MSKSESPFKMSAIDFSNLPSAFIAAESDFLAKFAILAIQSVNGGVGRTLAQSILNLCGQHEKLKVVDRVAIVRRLGMTNQIRLEQSASSDRVPSDSMTPGYSCFVRETSSLFQIQPGSVRVFGDIEAIKEAFNAERAPRQRSIQRISSMGLTSGLCIPVFGSGDVIGFIFLNSKAPHAFNLGHMEKWFCGLLETFTISLFKASGFLSFQYLALAKANRTLNVGKRFSLDTLRRDLVETKLGWDFNAVVVSGEVSEHVLFNPGSLSYTIAQLSKAVFETPKISIRSTDKHLFVSLQFGSSMKILETLFEAIKLEALLLGIEIDRSHNSYLLKQNIDCIKDQAFEYSVET